MDPRVGVSLKELVSLKGFAHKLDLSLQVKPSGMFAGQNKSRLRGKGFNFEELRPFREGDSLKIIDWKASQRSHKKVVKVFTEETDRPVMLICDQRSAMFFGSSYAMKSITSAKAFATISWLFFLRGDRVGGLILTDTDTTKILPRRGTANIMHLLSAAEKANHNLIIKDEKSHTTSNTSEIINNSLISQLEKAAQSLKQSGTLVIISDGNKFDDAVLKLIKTNSIKHNVMVFFITDPLELSYSNVIGMTISDGNKQITLPKDPDLIKKFESDFESKILKLRQSVTNSKLSFCQLTSARPIEEQLIEIFNMGK